MAQIHKPNLQFVEEEAARIAQRAEDRSAGQRKIAWYEWRTEGETDKITGRISDGWNYLRVLPPWSEQGLVFKLRWSWKNLPGIQGNDKYHHLLQSWPERNMADPIEEAINLLLRDYPELEEQLKEIKTTGNAFCNVIDRRNEAAGVQVARFPISIHNWFITEWKAMLAQGLDPTDTEQGVDFKCQRSEKIDGWYDPRFMGTETMDGFIPSPCPLSADPAVAETWLGELWDLDKIFHFPADDILASYQNMSTNLIAIYQKKALEAQRRTQAAPPTRPAPGSLRTPAGGAAGARPQAPGTTPAPKAPPATPAPVRPATGATQGTTGKAPAAPPPRPLPPRPPVGGKATPGAKGAPAPKAAPPPTQTAARNPTDKPVCFQDHQPGHSKCMMCPHEFDCMDATGRERVPFDWPTDELSDPVR